MIDNTKYFEEMKRKVVALDNNGKNQNERLKEYGMSRSTIHKWIKDYNNSGLFSAKDNRSDKEKELIDLRIENEYFKMENDILKQVGTTMGPENQQKTN
ncbi:Helix-turn-helix domain-containing protein [Halanaerobium congolense]|uniref:Helix-turn-helix domain-containing protein n=1 Tax=Halanaerobium congolense TaxID=54121 RepID=A0A1G8QY28_9FIRM|nr:Helix-turn-helix domain-containing protein [Halanaerobium congolense]SET70873.1 Helix-turn-helix domain-containing protein [Halanaerobium congolense]